MIASVAALALVSGISGTADYAPRNLAPDVAYVGDTVCAQCHSKEARTYRETAMGRSFALTSDLLAQGALSIPKEGASFVHKKSNTRYRIFVEEGRLKHAETRMDAEGRDLFTDTRTVTYVLGSGDRARTFLIQQGDRLFQSPLAFRPHRDGWGMAAGYDVEKQVHFTRNVPGACLFCHANRASFVETSTNRYREPVFDGLAIGCERCHGPGALHVAERRNEPLAPEGNRPTIVNPAWLPEELRDSVCFQCHLQGDMRVVKTSHPLYDFRPGLPLSDYFAVFHARRAGSEGAGGFKVVGHVERLRASRCWKQSGGRLACLTCHDPHRTPHGEEAVEQFRAACLTCHKTQQHPALAGQDLRNCVGCHMAKRPPSDAPHTVFTDHLIARTPAPPDDTKQDGEVIELVNYLEGDRGSPRDAGVANMFFARYEKDIGPAKMGVSLLEPLTQTRTRSTWRRCDCSPATTRCRISRRRRAVSSRASWPTRRSRGNSRRRSRSSTSPRGAWNGPTVWRGSPWRRIRTSRAPTSRSPMPTTHRRTFRTPRRNTARRWNATAPSPPRTRDWGTSP